MISVVMAGSVHFQKYNRFFIFLRRIAAVHPLQRPHPLCSDRWNCGQSDGNAAACWTNSLVTIPGFQRTQADPVHVFHFLKGADQFQKMQVGFLLGSFRRADTLRPGSSKSSP